MLQSVIKRFFFISVLQSTLHECNKYFEAVEYMDFYEVDENIGECNSWAMYYTMTQKEREKIR